MKKQEKRRGGGDGEEEDFGQAIEIDPHDPHFYEGRAQTCGYCGEPEQGKADEKTARRLRADPVAFDLDADPRAVARVDELLETATGGDEYDLRRLRSWWEKLGKRR